MTIDLVCGMDISEKETTYQLNHNDGAYYFLFSAL